MTTSANVVYYEVRKDGKRVGEHSQHAYCKNTVKDAMAKYQPPEDFTVIGLWPDENEVGHYSKEMSLVDFLGSKELIWEFEVEDKKVEMFPELVEALEKALRVEEEYIPNSPCGPFDRDLRNELGELLARAKELLK